MWRMRSSLLLRTEVLFEGAAIRRGWAGGRGGRLRVGCRMTVKRGGCVTYVILPSLLGGGELAEVGAVQVEAVQRWVGGMAIGGMSVGESPWRGGWGYA